MQFVIYLAETLNFRVAGCGGRNPALLPEGCPNPAPLLLPPEGSPKNCPAAAAITTALTRTVKNNFEAIFMILLELSITLTL